MPNLIENIDTSPVKNGIVQDDNTFSLTDGQKEAITRIRNWFSTLPVRSIKKKYFVLAGAAGTGKTSLVQYIVANLKLAPSEVLSISPTGKAALNMQRKGMSKAKTIHSAIYKCSKKNNKLIFDIKSSLDEKYRLIIVDESSMVSETIFNDLKRFNVPILFIGDHCQLPPVNENFDLMAKPDYILTEIVRQVKDSYIIKASQFAINGKAIPFCSRPGFRKIHEKNLTEKDLLWADQIIVGTNAKRKAVNDIMRELKGFTSVLPQKDEKMIVLRNCYEKNLYNGQIVYLDNNALKSTCRVCDELVKNDPIASLIYKSQDISYTFDENNTNDSKVVLDYGYAISCHKSQGSGWERVLVFDDGFGFDEETKRRWLYTAITRAKSELCIVTA